LSRGAFFRFLLVAGALGYLALAAMSLFPHRYWAFETLSNLRVQFAWAGLLLAVLLLMLRPRLLALPVAVMGTFCAHLALSVALPPRQPVAAAAAKLRVMTVNIDFVTHDADRLVAIIKAEHPDILVMEEDYPPVRRAIAERAGGFLYHAEAGIDPRAISIDSRYPLTDVHLESTDYVAHILTAKVAVPTAQGTAPVLVIATHPLAPIRRWKAAQRKKCLDYLGKRAGEAHVPVILLGDLNLTPHSPYFSALEIAGHLIDTAKGRAPDPTWLMPVIPFGLRIDHVLVSSGIAALGRHVTEGFGSDHRGVVVDLLIPPAVVPAGPNS